MATRAAVAAPRVLRRFFCSNSASSTFPFIPTPPAGAVPTPARPTAEPNTNLFVSGLSAVSDRYSVRKEEAEKREERKLYRLSKRTTTEKLREEFSKFGEVVHARVVADRVSGYSKGFGFVQYATIEEAAKGIEGMDGKFLDGWVIFAEYARPRPPPGHLNNSSNPFGRQ
ncbi:hypothetical protein V8G54_024214 [Vigna mungo]|uniref:RRM domain-containing protein n=1 Tax=Vigna mungo TaxID=3915 RepID=A0AAQ3RSC2_VIGMU